MPQPKTRGGPMIEPGPGETILNECAAVRRLLAMRLADRTEAERQQIKAHLAVCPDCAIVAQEYQEHDRLLRNGPETRLSSLQRQTLYERLEKERRWQVKRSKMSWVWGTLGAAVVVVALIFGTLWLRDYRKTAQDRPSTQRPVAGQATQTPISTPVQPSGLVPYYARGGQPFTLYYSPSAWQSDNGGYSFQNRTLPGCAFYPGFSQTPEEAAANRSDQQVTLGGRAFEWKLRDLRDQQQGRFINYLTQMGDTFFSFAVYAGDLSDDELARCRADAEAVLATMVACPEAKGSPLGAEERRPSDVQGTDLVFSYNPTSVCSDYRAESYSSVPLTSTYATERGAEKGLVRIVTDGNRQVQEYAIPKEEVKSVISVRYDQQVPDRTDVILTKNRLVLVHSYTANAGIFTVSDVYELPAALARSEYVKRIDVPQQAGNLSMALDFYDSLIYFGNARMELKYMEPPNIGPDGIGFDWPTSELAIWLGHPGSDPNDLVGILRMLPKMDTANPEVAVQDLNGDGRQDIVVQTHLTGVPIGACIAWEEGQVYVCHSLPGSFGEALPTADSGFLSEDLTGDGTPETIITYTVQGGSGWSERLYVFQWSGKDEVTPIFQSDLVNWAGESHWSIEPEPSTPGRKQIALTYPYLWADGFDHKMLNHPVGRQAWRFNDNTGRFALAEQTVDTSRSAGSPDAPIGGDQVRWLVNQAESAFRSGKYDVALEHYATVTEEAATWGSGGSDQPDWAGYARFRHAECLALLGRPTEALGEMQAVAADYSQDALSNLANAFLTGYGDGSAPDAAARGIAAMQQVDLYMHFYEERGGALRFPMDAAGILYPGAGLGAYLDAHPDQVEDAPLLAGLQEAGFAAEGVHRVDTFTPIVEVYLRLPQSPNADGSLVRWRLTPPNGVWQVEPRAVAKPGPSDPWVTVGDAGAPSLAAEPADSVPAQGNAQPGGHPVVLQPPADLANGVPITICQSSTSWVRPSDAEQEAEIWSRGRYKNALRQPLWWTLHQYFYNYHGSASEMYDEWPMLGLWAVNDPYWCDPDTRSDDLYFGKEVELWLLQYEAVSARKEGETYWVQVRPTTTGYQSIHLPGSGYTDITIHLLDESGTEIDRLPKEPPWSDPTIEYTGGFITVTGTVVENAASAQVVTVRDESGVDWYIPWLDSTVLLRADGSRTFFRDLQAGVKVQVWGLPRKAETENTVVAVGVIVRE